MQSLSARAPGGPARVLLPRLVGGRGRRRARHPARHGEVPHALRAARPAARARRDGEAGTDESRRSVRARRRRLRPGRAGRRRDAPRSRRTCRVPGVPRTSARRAATLARSDRGGCLRPARRRRPGQAPSTPTRCRTPCCPALLRAVRHGAQPPAHVAGARSAPPPLRASLALVCRGVAGLRARRAPRAGGAGDDRSRARRPGHGHRVAGRRKRVGHRDRRAAAATPTGYDADVAVRAAGDRQRRRSPRRPAAGRWCRNRQHRLHRRRPTCRAPDRARRCRSRCLDGTPVLQLDCVISAAGRGQHLVDERREHPADVARDPSRRLRGHQRMADREPDERLGQQRRRRRASDLRPHLAGSAWRSVSPASRWPSVGEQPDQLARVGVPATIPGPPARPRPAAGTARTRCAAPRARRRRARAPRPRPRSTSSLDLAGDVGLDERGREPNSL